MIKTFSNFENGCFKQNLLINTYICSLKLIKKNQNNTCLLNVHKISPSQKHQTKQTF